jgi:hypothetical protein
MVDHSSPDKDIRVEIPYLDPKADLLLIAGSLGKIERSPLFLIDSGINGSTPRIVREIDLDHLVAGSMGLVVPVPIDPQARSYLKKFIINEYDIVASFSDLAVAIFESWPSHMKHLLPRDDPHGLARDEWESTIVAMTIDLIKVSPIINGSFPVSLGHSERADHQALASLGSFHDLRMREITLDDLRDPSGISVLIRTIVQVVIDKTFPVWVFWSLEDIFTPFVQEIIRYIPHLYHLRASPGYGSHADPSNPIFRISAPQEHLRPETIKKISDRYLSFVGNRSAYDHPVAISSAEKIALRDAWASPAEIGAIPWIPATRPDLNPGPLDLNIWSQSLKAYIARMSFIHGQSTHPDIIIVKHIIDQFTTPGIDEFKVGDLGLSEPIKFITLTQGNP